MSQASFAELLEERITDISNPPGDWRLIGDQKLNLLLDLLNLKDDVASSDVSDLESDPVCGPDDIEDRIAPRTALYKLRKLRIAGAAAMQRMAQQVEVSITGKAVAAFNAKTGARTVTFHEDSDARDSAGRRVTIPDYFLLNVPVFENGPRETAPCRLYIRSRGQAILWSVILADWQRLINIAVHSVGSQIAEQTGVPVFYGQEPK